VLGNATARTTPRILESASRVILKLHEPKKFNRIANKQTYHNMHRVGPRGHRSIALNIEISLGLIDNLRNAVKLPSVPWCTTDILQLENGLDNLGNRKLGICRPRAVVESSTVKVVRS
jgi:hypothetical protein